MQRNAAIGSRILAGRMNASCATELAGGSAQFR